MLITASLVEGGDESAVVVERSEDKRVVLLVDLQRAGHVQLGVVQGFIAQLLDGGQALIVDMVLQEVPQLAQAVRNA